MTNTFNEREVVLDILLEVIEEGKYSHLVLRDVLDKYQFIDKKKRAFISRVVQGTLEHLIEIDYLINQVSSVKVKKMKPVIRNLMRSAVYQMKYMDHVPSSAICNETVKLSSKRGFKGLRGFVNGVLRNLDRKMDSIAMPDKKNINMHYSVKYSMPQWIVEHFLSMYDEDTLELICKAFQEQNGTFIRVNEHKISVEDLKLQLQEEGVEVIQHPYLSYGLEIKGYDSLNFLPSFNEGLFQVQDISSMLVSEVASPSKDDYIIDVCAAPGGKSLHLADKLAGTGMVEARDLTEYKVNFLEENIMRTGLNNMTAKQWDATVLDKDAIEKADIVIADLPCSGLGIIGKKSDLKYKVKPESLKELAALQQEILKVIIQYIKPGGKLIYSTCTINESENYKMADWIENSLGLKTLAIKELLPNQLHGSIKKDNQLQLLPGVHNCDGFFISAFTK